MGMSRYSWGELRNSLGSLQSNNALDSLRILSPLVITECMELALLRHQLAHPVIDLTQKNFLKLVYAHLVKALEHNLLKSDQVQALYDLIQKV